MPSPPLATPNYPVPPPEPPVATGDELPGTIADSVGCSCPRAGCVEEERKLIVIDDVRGTAGLPMRRVPTRYSDGSEWTMTARDLTTVESSMAGAR